MKQKDLYLITGFLGAGKTTFVKKAFEIFKNKKIAVIVNEFGKTGIDGSLIKNDGYNVTEISNGSIFCVCRVDMFIDALMQALKSDADILIVETSGLANPTNIDNVLDQTYKLCGERFNYKGCVCILDAKNFIKVFNTAIVVADQIKQASLIVINKIDTVEISQISQIENIIKKLNPTCKIIQTTYSNIPSQELISLNPISKQVKGTKQDLFSLQLTFEILNTVEKEKIIHLFDILKDHIYRAKGYYQSLTDTMFIDGVMNNISICETKKPSNNTIVLLYHSSHNVKKLLSEAADNLGIKIIVK